MLKSHKIHPGNVITASLLRTLYSTSNTAEGRPLSNVERDPEQFYCNVNKAVTFGSFAQITPGSFQDQRIAWCNVGDTGTNWVYFTAPAQAGATAVCRIIPYDRPVLLATGGNPQNGHRYTLPGVTEDENGEFTCVGSNGDGMLFWYVRNAGVGGGGSAPVTVEYCTLITPVCNGFVDDSIAWSAQHSTPKGFNALRCGLGRLQSAGTGQPLQVFTVNADTNQLVPKLDSGKPLFYKKLTIKLHTGGTTPEYDSLGGIEFNELTPTSTGWGGHAPFYAYLQSLNVGEAAVSGVQYDYSDLWETTTDATEAIPNNYVVVKPHQFMGYYPNKEQFKVGSTETIDLSVTGRSKSGTAYHLDYELEARVKLKGQWNGTIKYADASDDTITWIALTDVGSYVNNLGKVMIVIPEYVGTNITIMDVNKIENMCGIGDANIPIPMGMYIDNNNLPQFVNCDSMPFNTIIPLLSVACMYRINGGNCSPAYQTNSFAVELNANHITLLTNNYLPGSIC
jgi:hypothetical protein